MKLQRGLWLGGITLFCVLFTYYSIERHSSSSSSSSSSSLSLTLQQSVQTALRRLKQIEWGGAFNSGASSNGNFPKLDCNHLGRSICCSALENTEKKVVKHHPTRHCTTKKEYFPSPYEIKQLEMAEELAKIKDDKERTAKFVEFIETPEQVAAATKWLDRVAQRQPGHPLEENDVDREYLSRFKVTRKCGNMAEVSWYEYIEPLSVHARHPFGLGECWHPHHRDKIQVYKGQAPRASLLSVDFLLLQSQHDLNGPSGSNSSHHHAPPSSFVLDAGTSRFDTSMYWFVCIYEQLGFVLDQIFGWEYTLLEPENFWEHVPLKYVGLYHFFNAPISGDSTSRHSPVRLIKQIATAEDFVSFKLDVDTPAVEIPIALDILKDTHMHSILDEFFFELHFRCEVLMDCGWGYGMPETFQGLTLDRPSALKLFRDLRKGGIRAHFWP